jgi:uncharacterized protein
MSTNISQNSFASLASEEFIVLTTYRRDGRAVPTTVWFAYESGKVYITTSITTGKMKRVRNNGHVEMTPSDRIGNLLGKPSVQGKAHEANTEEGIVAHTLLEQKYGEHFRQLTSARTSGRTYIVVEPELSSSSSPKEG